MGATPKTAAEKLQDRKDMMREKLSDPEYRDLVKQMKAFDRDVALDASLAADFDKEATVAERKKIAKAKARINRSQHDQNTVNQAAKLDKEAAEAVKGSEEQVSDALKVLVAEGKLTEEQAKALRQQEAQA